MTCCRLPWGWPFVARVSSTSVLLPTSPDATLFDILALLREQPLVDAFVTRHRAALSFVDVIAHLAHAPPGALHRALRALSRVGLDPDAPQTKGRPTTPLSLLTRLWLLQLERARAQPFDLPPPASASRPDDTALALWQAQGEAVHLLLHHGARAIDAEDRACGLPWRLLLALPQRRAQQWQRPPAAFHNALFRLAARLVVLYRFPLWGPSQRGEADAFVNACFRILMTASDTIDQLCRLLRLVIRHTLQSDAPEDVPRVRTLFTAAIALTVQRISREWRWELHCLDRLLNELSRAGFHVTEEIGQAVTTRTSVSPFQAIHLGTRTYARIFLHADYAYRRRANRALRTLHVYRYLSALPTELQLLIGRFARLGPMETAARLNAVLCAHPPRLVLRRALRAEAPRFPYLFL
jgi:hypothetical protein